ncbi:MAG: acyl carrier protein [Sandaracinaceae bacterium]|nr:acyl carrier protein [Sandaracinaceae bacterium]
MSNLAQQLKELIVEALMLEDVTASEIEDEMPLFREGLGLDSIDALELGIAVERKFGIKLSESEDVNREAFRSVKSLASYITAQQGAGATP